MSSSGDQKICVSIGVINGAFDTYLRLKQIIKEETGGVVLLSTVIRQIFDIKETTYNHYINLNGPQRGRISKHTALNLKRYAANLPYGVCTGHQSLTATNEETFRQCLRRDF